MVKAESRRSTGTNVIRGDHASRPKTGPREIPAAELLSFLKEVRGVQTWTEKDLAKILRIGLPQAKEAIAVLQLQGYSRPGIPESGESQIKVRSYPELSRPDSLRRASKMPSPAFVIVLKRQTRIRLRLTGSQRQSRLGIFFVMHLVSRPPTQESVWCRSRIRDQSRQRRSTLPNSTS